MLRCPVCGDTSKAILDLPVETIRADLRRVFRQDLPPDLIETDYTMRRCAACDLVFADPMRPGSAAFYAWLTAFDSYHARARWEWGEVRRHLERYGDRPVRMMELGCGTGLFLEYISDMPTVSVTGIDLSESSVRAARAKGLDARHADLDDVLRTGERFDIVMLSHVLEHVADPLGLARTIISGLKPGGALVFSVPYSPMSREHPAWDIMNLPPHHMTRWNARSLRALADATGTTLSLRLSKPKSPFKRALKQTALVTKSGTSALGRFAALLRHPRTFRTIHALHARRERVNGRRAGDTVLAILSLPG
ncbi:class I SAM-dependent methyltransferase [Caenispirillum salinarum]|uniref:class I SAM-dependent methyltransferase n=1 Tax=Caenispirillum salinarum TaxID=859058 RepID=UPI00384C90DC